MMEEPGSLAGRMSSISPVRGPEPSQRMSLAILYKLTAAPLSAAWARAMRSSVASAVNLLGADLIPNPVSPDSTSATASPKPGGELRPVPTAVPPIATCNNPAPA